MVRLQHKVSASLKQALEKLKLSENSEEKKGENRTLSPLLSPLYSSIFLLRLSSLSSAILSPSTSFYSLCEGQVDS